MSDDADQYFNAWRGVFGENGTKKYCAVGMSIGHGGLPCMNILLIIKTRWKYTTS